MFRWLSLILYTIYVTGFLGGLSPTVLPPHPTPQQADIRGEDVAPPPGEISPSEEQAMWAEIQRNISTLRATGSLAQLSPTQSVAYIFPLRMAPGLPDYAGFYVSAFPDHNPTSGQVQDYNGGARTYDGHRGTDYALWPYSWNKVDAGEVQVIAAAAGTIVAKANVDSSDHNCGGSSTDPWNYVALTHADGRMTIYGHMRYNSITSKGIGQTVAQGEMLGTAASSGNSTGPHLHFEVRYGSFSTSEWIDPYAGPNSQPASLWANQRRYYDSAINKLTTHSSPPSTPDPCQPSIPHLQDSFTTPVNIYFYTYYRDYQETLSTQLKIYRPDGSIFQSWQDVPANSTFNPATSRGKVFSFSSTDPAGTWRFEASYNGQVYETFFNLNAPPLISMNSPNGGEQWDRNLTHSLTWTDNLGGDVNIALYLNGMYTAEIANNTPSGGVYIWTPDSSLTPGPGYTIRMTSVINPAVYDTSDTPFTLTLGGLTARDDFIMSLTNLPVTIDALGNDWNPNGAPITISASGVPTHGSVSVVNNHFVYTPTLGFLGTDSFTYTINTSTEEAAATVTVQVVNEIFRSFLPLTLH